MPLQNMAAELEGTFPRLPYLHAIQVINRAWARVRDVRLWSWQLIVDSQLYTPDEIHTGTISATQFSSTLRADPVAAAAISGATGSPPVASPVLGMGRQIRVGLSTGIVPGSGNIYNIIAWDGVNTLTIDKPFAEASVVSSAYRIYRCYFAPPSFPSTDKTTPVTVAVNSRLAGSGVQVNSVTLDAIGEGPVEVNGVVVASLQLLPGPSDGNWIRPMTMVNRQGNYSVSGRRLFSTQVELNRIDPARTASDSYFWRIAAYQRNSLGQPTYEMYPHPTLASAYGVTYYTRWPDISETQDLPLVPYGLRELVMDLARSFCCQWSIANMATFAELQQTNWVAAQANYKQDYMDGLKMCLRQDDEIMPQVPFKQGPVFDLPLGGAFLQNHDLLGMLQ